MKIFTFIIIACLALILIEGAQLFWRIRGSADITEWSKTFSHENGASSYTVLVVGDSTAAGVGASKPEESIAGRLFTDFPSISLMNVGEAGLRLANVIAKLETVNDRHFNLVIIQAGGNDVVRLTPLEDLEKNLEEVFLRALKIGDQVAFLPAGNIGLAPIFPWPLNWLLTARARKTHEIYLRQVAKHNILFADFFNERKDDIFATDIKRYYAPDVFHPSGEWYRLWYETFGKALAESGVRIPR